MLYVLYYTLCILAWKGQTVFSYPATYDQRQTGDVNVQIHLKDVQVVALLDSELLEDYTDYDYSYDYADFTIKPIIKPTTSGSTIVTSSIKPWHTWPTNPPTSASAASTTAAPGTSVLNVTDGEEDTSPSSPLISTVESQINSTETNDSEARPATNETTVKLRINNKIGDEFLSDEVDSNNEQTQSVVTYPTIQSIPMKRCPSGYVLGKKGRCRSTQGRRRISLVPLTMKLGSQLSERSKFAIRKDLPIRVYKSEDQP